MPEALAQVKRELGDQAVILGTRSCPGKGIGALTGRSRVEITAAPPAAAAFSPPQVRAAGPAAGPAALPAYVYPYYRKLVENEVAEQLALRLARQVGAQVGASGVADARVVQEALRHAIAEMIPVTGGLGLKPGVARRVALVGPAGAGKTTTLAKLAAHFGLRLKKRVAIISLDTQGLGSNEHMRRYAEIIGVEMHAAQTVVGVKRVLRGMEGADLVLIDTHGVCAGDREHFGRLAAMLRATRADEVHLVLPASMIPSVQARMAQRFGPLGVSGVVLTHLDEAVGLGVVLNGIEKLEWGLSYVTDGETVPNNIQEACPKRMAQLIFPMGG
jgi:flagellar biosynthesis protein FlhF